MGTRILNSSEISLAASALKRGEAVVFPTETVYGLGACLFQEAAVKKIFEIKGRPQDNPLIAHIASVEQVGCLSNIEGLLFDRLIQRFWPGPLTLVVPRKKSVPSIVSAGQPTIAIRLPSHDLARKLILEVGEPLVAPSANLSGRPSPTTVADVLEDLEGKVGFVLEGGPCSIGIESTVLSLYHPIPTLLRPGQITLEMLEDCLERKVALPQAGGPILSPGMKYRHYAPKARVDLVTQEKDLKGEFLIPTQQNLYALLREADRKGASTIQIFCNEAVQKDFALMNRLLRASGKIT